LGSSGPNEIGEEWEGFIAGHYPFYAILLQAAIWRLMRMELSSPRLAVCLFRTTKVCNIFNQIDFLPSMALLFWKFDYGYVLSAHIVSTLKPISLFIK
jgi:hypothetical protein